MRFSTGLDKVLENIGGGRKLKPYITPGGEIWDTELQRWIPKKDWLRRQAGLKPFKVGKTKEELLDERDEDDDEDDDDEEFEITEHRVYYLGGKRYRRKIFVDYLTFGDWVQRWWPKGIPNSCTRFRVQDCVSRSLHPKKMCKPCKEFNRLEAMWNEAQVGK
jgi:hypothetical protein